MFTEQQSQTEQALIRGGIPADSAKEITDAFMNCALAIAHRGPMTLDYTPKNFRFIGPDSRKYQFPGVDAPQGTADFRPPLIPPGEGTPITDPWPVEPGNARDPFGPSQDPGEVPTEHGTSPDRMGPLRQIRVVTDVGYNKKTNRMEVEFSTIWGWYGGIDKVVELKSPTVNVVTNIRSDPLNNVNARIYGDVTKIGVLSAGEVERGKISFPYCCASGCNTAMCLGKSITLVYDWYYTRDAVPAIGTWTDPPSVAADLPHGRESFGPHAWSPAALESFMHPDCSLRLALTTRTFGIPGQPLPGWYWAKPDGTYALAISGPAFSDYPVHAGAALVYRWYPGGLAYTGIVSPVAWAPAINAGYEQDLDLSLLCGGTAP